MRIIIFIIMSWSTFALGSTQSEIDELKKRIDELEKQQGVLFSSTAEPRSNVHSFISNNLTFGGFFETGYNLITGPDTETQAVNDSNVIGLNIAADLGNKFRFVSQFAAITAIPLQNQHNHPGSDPEEREYNTYTALAAVTQGYVEYNFSRKLNLQAGIGYVPFGFSLQLREPVLYVRRNGPQIVRTGSLISILWQGLHLYGSSNFKDGEMGYDLYTFTPTSDVKMLGVGGRVWMSDDEENVVAGVSSQFAEDDKETFTNLGADLKLNFQPFQIRSEFIHKFTQNSDTWSAYVEPGYFIYQEELLFYVYGDYLFGAQNETSLGLTRSLELDPIQKWEYGGGLNWLPTSYTRFRLGITFHDYVGFRAKIGSQNRDYFSTDLSVGVAF